MSTDAHPTVGGRLERLRPRLLARIRLMMGPAAAKVAETADFFQELCVEALRDQASVPLDDERATLRWLTAAARNNLRDEQRRRRERAFAAFSDTLTGPEGDDTSPSSAAARAERAGRVAEALEELSDEHRAIVELRDLDGLSFRAAGERLGRSEEAARKLHVRALIQLGRSLKHPPGE